MEASYFIDNKERIFVPYKGWMTRDSNGIESKDEFTTKIKGPFKDIPDPLGHGHYHTLDNLIGHDGKKILPKGVRHITFYPEGYYYIDDNNEDELINRGDVHGGFLAKDYIEQKNIVNTAGKILSDIWFDDLTPMVNGYFRVSIDGKSKINLPSLPVACRKLLISVLSGASGLAMRNFTRLFLYTMFKKNSSIRYCLLVVTFLFLLRLWLHAQATSW